MRDFYLKNMRLSIQEILHLTMMMRHHDNTITIVVNYAINFLTVALVLMECHVIQLTENLT